MVIISRMKIHQNVNKNIFNVSITYKNILIDLTKKRWFEMWLRYSAAFGIVPDTYKILPDNTGYHFVLDPV